MGKIFLGILQYAAADSPQLENEARRVSGAPLQPQGKNPDRFLSHLAGRAALGGLLQHLGWEGTVTPDPEYGYLVLKGKAGRFVSLSHTRDLAVAVAAEGPVGVDAEWATRDTTRVMTRVSLPAEAPFLGARLEVGDLKVAGELALWSGKEAASKAAGLGMKFGLQAFELVHGPGEIFSVKSHVKGP